MILMFPVKDLFPSINQTYVLRGNTEASCIQGYTYLHMGAMGGGGGGAGVLWVLANILYPFVLANGDNRLDLRWGLRRQ